MATSMSASVGRGLRFSSVAALTVAALHDLDVEPGLLHARAHLVRRHRLDGLDGAGAHSRDGHDAGAHRLAVEVNGARPALGDAAAELRPRKADQIAQHPQQGHVGRRVDLARRPVDGERVHAASSPPPCGLGARRAPRNAE
jgi:hypothetical protein